MVLLRFLILSGDLGLFYKKPEGDICNWAQKACGRCWHFWQCYRQTPPWEEAMPNHSTWSWQRLKDKLLLYYFAFWSDRLSVGGRQWRVFIWCQENSIAMTRTSRWKETPGRWWSSLRGRDASSLRWWWSLQGLGHWWWPWLAYNEPSAWASRRWQGLSHSCLPSSPSKLANPWQNLSIIRSSDGLELARIVNHRMACVGLLLRLGIYCIPSCNRRCHSGALASSIFVQQIHVFSWCQSSLLVDHCDTCWWVLSK